MKPHRAYRPRTPTPPPCECGVAMRVFSWVLKEIAYADGECARYAEHKNNEIARYYAGRRDVLGCDELRDLLGIPK